MKLDQIEALLHLLNENKVGTFEYEDEGVRLSVSFGVVVAAPVPAAPAPAPAAPVPAARLASNAEAASAGVTSGHHEVRSPMVGTFYRAPKPGAAAFVDVGARVTVGQTLCIVEAMKLLNEIESDVAGVVREILVENERPVQFNQPLFRIEAD